MMRHWSALGALCAVLVLSACGRSSSAASVVTSSTGAGATSAAGTGTAKPSDPQTTTTGSVRALPGGTPAEQTQPQITPRRGGPRTVFTVRLTSRAGLGAHGPLAGEYRVRSVGPPKPGCDREATSTIRRGAPGRRLTVVLRPGPGGWCRGDWLGVVLLERGPSCPGGPAAKPRCPEFASQLLEVGRFRWRIR
jgi:hypothetical protein